MFSGGTMSNFSIILMGVGPYITASIIIQLLGHVIPALENLAKEGESGQRKLNQYTRYLTVPLAAIQAYAMIKVLERAGASQGGLSFSITGMDLLVAVIVVTGGTMLLMWLGELISENGIGNGVSLIIAIGIIAGMPEMARNTLALIYQGGLDTSRLIGLIAFIIIAVLAVAFIVLINEGQRNIPVSYAKRVRGMRMYGGADSHLPLRVNQAGVIPIIFALAILVFPATIARFFEGSNISWLASVSSKVVLVFGNNIFYGTCYFFLVVAFTYFYTAVVFDPVRIAENLQKQGGFVPGIRPGTQTISYLKKILNRVTLTGSIFLGIIAILPFVVQAITHINTLVLGGTGILIIVSVILETQRQLNAMLATRSYDNF
ncbi:MAG: preprotein translocase subunit SecY [Candidatus Berkelbacteria bacterium Licking1014_96]|uniref:Protein translocase subunit SecY n=1 Tax=Candidatus Berkelbacteria bacterium Licking1014_96 TaxID=2017149 RepID=A0A554LHB4_9BACT|nr:MAG: preprotein translocase subunit SecY [Candidatus Berkelbacteria bacterium Licking1014_96]